MQRMEQQERQKRKNDGVKKRLKWKLKYSYASELIMINAVVVDTRR